MDKKQLLKWGAFVTAIIVVVGVIGSLIYFLSDNEMLDGSFSMGDVLVVHSSDGELSFYDEEEKRLYEETSVKADYVLVNNNATAIYAIEKGTPNSLTKIWLEGETLKSKELYEFENQFSENSEIKWAFDFGAILDKDTKEFTVILPEFFEVKTIKPEGDGEIEAWQISDDSVYYAQNKTIYRVDYEGNIISKTSVEESTVGLELQSNHLIAVSNFGSGNEKKTLITLDSETLDINDLNMVDGKNIQSYPRLVDDSSIYLSSDEELMKSVDTVKTMKETQLPKSLISSKWLFFGNRFSYVINDNGSAIVYPTKNTHTLFELKGDYQSIYPLYSTETVEETLEETAEKSE